MAVNAKQINSQHGLAVLMSHGGRKNARGDLAPLPLRCGLLLVFGQRQPMTEGFLRLKIDALADKFVRIE